MGAKLHGVTLQKTFNISESVSVGTETEKQDQKGHDTRPRFVVSDRHFRAYRMSENVGKQPRTCAT